MGPGEHDDEPHDEGSEDEHAPRGAPPNPLDRVWVHPTELANLPPGVAPRKLRPSLARRSRRLIVPTLAGVAGALITVAILALTGTLDRGTTSNQPVQTGPTVPGGDSAQQVAARIGLSVVAVAARDSSGSRFGSGVCVRHAGEVLTTSRLVGNAKTVDILTSDGQRHPAKVIGRDRSTDLVLLAIDAGADVPAAQLADRAPRVGTSVWIMGATTAASSSAWMSAGLLSSVDAAAFVPKQGPMTGGLLETDAASGTAAVGGALVDSNGDVAGIVLGRLNGNPTTYAMPIDTAVTIAEQLHVNGVAQHGSAGMTIVDGPKGPTVTAVNAAGPAWQAGIKVGDVVSTVDDHQVESMTDVVGIVHDDGPGHVVEFEVVRRGTEYKLQVTLEAVNG